jgi:nucleoside-diphosphate-sugar epimerase
MKALVTGSTGFVGGHLVEALRARGDDVTALVRSPRKAERFIGTGIATMEGDLHDPEVLENAAAGKDVIFHVAGVVAARDEGEFLRVNRDGTSNLVRAAERSGKPRMVLVSSLAAAGPSEPDRPLRGGEPDRPLTAYGRSKLAGERVVREGALPWCILRPPAVYGPSDTEFLRVFQAARRGIAPVFGAGDQVLSFVYGPDLAEALVAVALTEGTEGKTYYPCHPERVTTRGFALAVGKAVGKAPRVIRIPERLARGLLAVTGAAARLAGKATVLNSDKANEFFAPAWIADPAPLTEDTGWSARHDVAAGLAATADWYRGVGWL